MRALITAGGLCSADAAWFTGRPISYLMKKESTQSITGEYTGPNNWHYALQMIFGRNKSFLGVVTLYRTIGKEDFTYEDVFLMDMLKDHMAYRLYQERTHQMTAQEKMTMTEAVKKYNLTKREQTILGLLLQGMENAQICDQLSITVNTLKKHILNIYRKLGIRNRVQMFKLVKEQE